MGFQMGSLAGAPPVAPAVAKAVHEALTACDRPSHVYDSRVYDSRVYDSHVYDMHYMRQALHASGTTYIRPASLTQGYFQLGFPPQETPLLEHASLGCPVMPVPGDSMRPAWRHQHRGPYDISIGARTTSA